EWFRSRAEAKVLIERWRQFYNEQRPHSAHGYKPPGDRSPELVGTRYHPPRTHCLIGYKFHTQVTASDAPGPGGRGTAGGLARCRAGEGDAPPLAQRLGRPDARARLSNTACCGVALRKQPVS